MRLSAVLRQRCPRCLRGPIFEGLFRMRAACGDCGLRFEREAGYFLGAMYFSYALSILAGLPAFLVLWNAGWEPFPSGLAVTACIAAAAPLSFRLSRVLWLHLDQSFDPR